MKRWLFLAPLMIGACSSGPELPPIPEREDLKLDLAVQPVYGALLDKPNDPRANGELAIVLHRLGQYGEAELLYRRAHLLAPTSFQWLYYISRAQALQGNYIAAVATMRQALAIDGSMPAAQLAVGEYSRRGGDLVAAAEAFRGIQGNGPAAAWAAFRLGQIVAGQAALGEDVVAHLHRACELSPDFGAAHYALALQYERMRRPANSTQHFHTAAEHRLTEPRVPDPLMQAVFGARYQPMDHVSLGYQLIDGEQAAQATAAFRQALQLDPVHLEANVGLIRSYGRLGRSEDALRHFEQAVKLSENYDDIYVQYGGVLIELHRFQEAGTLFARALEVNPHSAAALAYQGYLAEQSGDYEKAAEDYRSALANAGDFPQVHVRIGAMFLRTHQEDKAAEEFATALRSARETSPRMLFQIGLLYEKTGDPANAERYRARGREAAASFDQSTVDWVTEASRWPLG